MNLKLKKKLIKKKFKFKFKKKKKLMSNLTKKTTTPKSKVNYN